MFLKSSEHLWLDTNTQKNLCMFHAGPHNVLLNLSCPTGIPWAVPGRLWSWMWDGRQPRDKFALPGPQHIQHKSGSQAAAAQVVRHASGKWVTANIGFAVAQVH